MYFQTALVLLSAVALTQNEAYAAPSKLATRGCRDPVDLATRLKELQASDPNHRTLFGSSPNTAGDIDLKDIVPGEGHFYESTGCPNTLPTEGDLNERSMCPYDFAINEEVGRFPRLLADARCKCTSCVSVDKTNAALGCERIFYNVRVLRRGKCQLEDGFYEYNEGWARIAVGCVCAQKRLGSIDVHSATTTTQSAGPDSFVPS